jgi:hypothetical protein
MMQLEKKQEYSEEERRKGFEVNWTQLSLSAGIQSLGTKPCGA